MKIHLVGGDNSGWALDTDLRLARQALARHFTLVGTPAEADCIHTVWPEQLLEDAYEGRLARGKPVVAVFSNDPVALFEQVPGLYAAASSWSCIAQSLNAEKKLRALGLTRVSYVPYIADLENFRPMGLDVGAERAKLGIPKDRYVIGSFQRDSMGSDLSRFKPQKGADAFAAILLGLARRVGRDRVHVLFAGPRRHWLRKQLARLEIPFTFVGIEKSGDDYPENILSAAEICKLTALLDVYIVASRWEGGPRAVLETVACRKKIISTRVGLAEDVLNPACLFDSISDAIALLEDDVRANSVAASVDEHAARVARENSVAVIGARWKDFYSAYAARRA